MGGDGMAAGERACLIVDGANVMGSRPDGWWRDRAGAMARLHGQLTRLAGAGIPADDSPEDAGPGPWHPRVLLVVEGKAKDAIGQVTEDPAVELVAAPGSGDDEIASLAAALPGRRYVVTADRELRRRCLAVGAEVLGPGWLTRLFGPAE